MTGAPEREYWRVGYHADPAGFIPRELCAWNHRFDDVRHRFRSVYVAELAETAIREVLAPARRERVRMFFKPRRRGTVVIRASRRGYTTATYTIKVG